MCNFLLTAKVWPVSRLQTVNNIKHMTTLSLIVTEGYWGGDRALLRPVYLGNL